MEPQGSRAVRVAREHVRSADAALETLRACPAERLSAPISEAQELLDQVLPALDRLAEHLPRP